MKTHELKVYPHHLSFLEDFPRLADWLNCRGYVVRHSHEDFTMRVIYTFWDDHTSEGEQTGINDASESLMVAYCRSCGTIEVCRRCMVTDRENEGALVGRLEDTFMAAQTPQYPAQSEDSKTNGDTAEAWNAGDFDI